jgi:hypothetical protein
MRTDAFSKSFDGDGGAGTEQGERYAEGISFIPCLNESRDILKNKMSLLE